MKMKPCFEFLRETEKNVVPMVGFSRRAWAGQGLMRQMLWRYVLIWHRCEAMPGRCVAISGRCVSTHRECLSSF